MQKKMKTKTTLVVEKRKMKRVYDYDEQIVCVSLLKGKWNKLGRGNEWIEMWELVWNVKH